ncbi:hypothetical protein ACWEQ2_37355 [Streptomyces sp. NPDC004096]
MATAACQANGTDITQSSSVADAPDWLQGVLQVLPQQENHLETASRFARQLVALPAGAEKDALRGLRVVLATEGRDAAPYVIDAALTHPWAKWSQVCDVATELAAPGERDGALRLWKHALGFPNPPEGSELALLIDMQAAGLDAEAADHLETLINASKTPAPRRLRLRQLLAWLQVGRQTSQHGRIPIQRGITAGKSTIESSLPEAGP